MLHITYLTFGNQVDVLSKTAVDAVEELQGLREPVVVQRHPLRGGEL